MEKISKGSVNYRPEHAMAASSKKSKKSPAKPIIKKKMENIATKKPVKTKGQKGKI